VFLTNASMAKPLQPFDDDDDHSLMENYCITGVKQQWDMGHPPQKSERTVRVHVLFTLLLCALATAYRMHCEREAMGGELMGWQCWRRQLLEETRQKVMVFAQGDYSIGSGSMESANKFVCHVRLKRSGVWGYVENASKNLASRCAKY
jgi:hypothetical protein